ncbi:hybrid signal transduction histidine kinase G-like [Microplitis demolitor]|uniref:hybrid signal transduction histidine kinase G-like n=1 Tax=Microplitis demolitor TaxID=69319 RepID=UPI0004CC9405|nr:hybrid signal transduction histidine kinase G-like [Microplitis demolitor]
MFLKLYFLILLATVIIATRGRLLEKNCLRHGQTCNINSDCCSVKCALSQEKTFSTCITQVNNSTDNNNNNNSNNNSDEITIKKIETRICRANGYHCAVVEECCSKFCLPLKLVAVTYMYCAPKYNV